MTLAIRHQTNLDTIIRAAANRDLAVVECQDKFSHEPVPVMAAVYLDASGEYVITGLARMFTGNPYAELLGPGEVAA